MGPKSFKHIGPLELVVYFTGKDAQVHRLPLEGTVRIGRDHRNDVEIQDTSVSRNHAVLHIGSELRIEDKSSCNGTEVYKPGRYSGTDTTVAQKAERGKFFFDVDLGDRIKVGSVFLVVRKALFEPEKGTSGPRMWTGAPTISDPQMEALYEDVKQAAMTSMPVPVLVYGETGAGKECVAREVHDESPRKSRPFVAVNCTQFVQTLVESALFGYVKGAFDGAKTDKRGFLDEAHTGTLFMDEIADLPLETQAKMLRVLDFGEVYPVGATIPHYVDVRVVAATNKNLVECIRRGTFREDLYYRLKGFEFEVPPLRKRPLDIIALAERFLSDACRRDNQPDALRFSESALACLRNYPFPGNVRELKKAVEVAAVRCRGTYIQPEHLPPEISRISPLPPPPESMPPVFPANPTPMPSTAPMSGQGSPEERAMLVDALHRHGGNQKAAAASLGMCNRTLVNRLNRYPDIPRPKKKYGHSPITDLPPTTPSNSTPHEHSSWTRGEY
jgi:two-component system, NtrC family, response regulator AtoC